MEDGSDDGGKENPKPLLRPSILDDDPELDALLDDALKDFGKLPPAMKCPKMPGTSKPGAQKSKPGFNIPGDGNEAMSQVWTEEFIKQATAQFEKKMRECLNSQDTPGACSSPGTMKTAENLSKVVETATKAAVGNSADPIGLASQINESLKHFTSPADANPFGGNPDFFDEDISKLMGNFQNFGLPDGAGDPELDEILPFMTNVMQKLLSKDLLYPVLTDIVDRYPDWLADNRPKISSEDFDRYNKQYDYMKKICEEYAAEEESDTTELKRKRFDKISDLMMKVQCTGPPPTELVGDEGLPGVDPSGALGMGDQCSIM